METNEALPPLAHVIAADTLTIPQPGLPLIPFVKAHACGNDFLILNEAVANQNHAALARKLCSRNQSIGADGIEFLDRRADGSFFIRLFNSDGTEAELSGNGTRCVAAWLAATEGIATVTLETHGGPRVCNIVDVSDPTFLIRTDMGVPRVLSRSIDIPGIGIIPGAMVNVGNPHFVLFLDNDLEPDHPEAFRAYGLSWQELGALIATNPMFRYGTNVEFVRVLNHDEIAFRIFERGCGPTTSSGTGTCASTAAAMTLQNTSRRLTAIAEGGIQTTVWDTPDASMYLTGPAEIICRGEVVGI